MIIVLFGPDGSGKTTIARMLMSYLSSRGIKASYVRFKSHHLVMYLILSFLRKLSLIPSTNSPRILDYSLKRYFNKSKLYVFLELINAIVWLVVNVMLRKLVGERVIVADRYVPDLIVSMLIIAPNKSILINLSKILKIFMQHTVKVFLYTDVNVALNRKKEELLSYTYITILLRLYMHVIRIFGVDLHINTSRYSKDESLELIKSLIESYFRRYK